MQTILLMPQNFIMKRKPKIDSKPDSKPDSICEIKSAETLLSKKNETIY